MSTIRNPIYLISGFFIFLIHSPLLAAQLYPGTNMLFNPGHYAAIHKDADLASRYAQDRIRPMVGVNKPYTWKYLEKAKGVYDFSQIERDLALLNGQGKKLIIQLLDKTFANREVALPDYLVNPNNPQYSAEYKGGHTLNFQGGYTAKKWVPAVNQRLQALCAQLGARFNGKVEAVQFTETATSLRGALQPADYSNAAYAAGIISNIRALRNSFPATVVQQMVNGMPAKTNNTSYMADLIAAAQAAKVGLSTVDTHPYDTRWWETTYKHFLPHSTNRRAPEGALVAKANFQLGTSNAVTPAEMAQFSINKLGASYIFWGTANSPVLGDIYKVASTYKTVLQP